jgi:glycosyltransferase involved in cell wall biosynthesis
MSNSTPRRLLVVSHVVHYQWDGQLFSYGPYAREIDIWADLFPTVRIASPLRRECPPKDCLPFTRSNISMVPQLETGGDNLWAKLLQLLVVPLHLLKLSLAMIQADVVHVRCPGNLGLLGVILAPLLCSRHVAKYAGQWNGYEHEPFSVVLQRRILMSWWWRRGLVTVYGEWPKQPRQVIPFFTSMMTKDQVDQSKEAAASKKLELPLQVVFSGRLVPLKAVDLVLRALAKVGRNNVPFTFTVVGGGPEQPRLEQLARELGIQDRVQFVGAIPFSEVMSWYNRAHILVLASNHSEGWPKVVAEAMCHGLVCVGSSHGLLPWMLRDRGATFEVGDVDGLAATIQRLATDPEDFQRLSRNAAVWAQGFSLEGLQTALWQLLSRSWNIELRNPPPPGASHSPRVSRV